MDFCEMVYALPEDRRKLVAELVKHLAREGGQSDVDTSTGHGAAPDSEGETPSSDSEAPVEEDPSEIASANEDVAVSA